MDDSPPDLDEIVADARLRHRDGDLAAAKSLYDSVLARAPNHAEVLQLKGILHAQSGAPADGLALLKRAVALAPADARIRANLAKLRLDLGDIDGAVADYAAADKYDPGNPSLAFNFAGALARAGQYDEAIGRLETARERAPNNPEVLANLGNLYRFTGRMDLSRDALEGAVAAAPDNPETHHSLGATLAALRDYTRAALQFREALRLDPGFVRAATQLFYTALHACDWADYAKLVENFRRMLGAEPALLGELSPLVALYLPFSQGELNRIGAARAVNLAAPAPAEHITTASSDRLRVGYLSADLGAHPVGRLLADVLPRHDGDTVDVTAFILADPDGSDAQQAIHAGVPSVENLSRMSPAKAAERIRGCGTDILVDLGGFTLGARPEILAARAAPLQVGWLGYCGSMGGLNDVLLADDVAVPPVVVPCFAEAVAYLPGSFMPLNCFDAPGDGAGARADQGLPDDGFVYCAFNAPTKIDPETFAAWMDILAGVEGAVLWLREHAPTTTENLRAAARTAGIDPQRLVFAPTAPAIANHLARHWHADLFLDTFVYGAHSTAADAIALGLPLLTRVGGAMPARVGASLCHAHDLSELVTETASEYIEAAIRMGTDTEWLHEMRARLSGALGRADAGDGFARKLEVAYRGLWRAHSAGTLVPGTLAPLGDNA